MTQAILDAKVLAVAAKGVDMMYISASLRRQGDPAAARLEEEYMFLQNVLYAVRDYDVTSDLLTADDINYLFELATNVVQSHP